MLILFASLHFYFINHMIQDNPEGLAEVLAEMKRDFHKGLKGQTVKARKQTLRLLLDAYAQFKPRFNEALKADLNYSPFMSEFAAHSVMQTQVEHLIAGLDKWAKPKSVPTSVLAGIASSEVLAQPLGVVLVISAWNYPIYTALPQVAAAIAAGNSVLLKPSEMAPHCSKVLSQMFSARLDKRYYRVMEGRVEVAKALTSLPFDLICFTGSTQTGRFVAMAAAKNLTPCLLQLGGKCPVIVDESADVESAVKRILVGKFFNCGQTCIGVDHVFVHCSIKEKFKEALKRVANEFYGQEDLQKSGNYGKIINAFHYSRLERLIKDNHGGQILFGGNSNPQALFIAPLIIEEPRPDCLLMQEEIFGPVLPFFPYESLPLLIEKINEEAKPLVVYLFSRDGEHIKRVERETSSGAFVVNDAIVQMVNADLPFGGVGASGYGRYHGESGFKAFSNEKSIMRAKPFDFFPLDQRFPPYTPAKQKRLSFMLKMGGITHGKVAFFAILLLLVIAGVTLAAIFIK